MGKLLLKILRFIGNVFTLGLYRWLKNRYDDKS